MTVAAGDAHPYPIYNARFRVVFTILDADGDLVTGAATLDSEASQNQGTFTDCTNEAKEIATSSGVYYLDLIATEMDTQLTSVIVKTATAGAKTTTLALYPKRLPVIRTGTAQAGAATTITLDSGASAVDDYYVGCYVNCTNDTPTNVLGQARLITDYAGSTKVATVESAWGTNPSSSTTFEILETSDRQFKAVDVQQWLGGVVATPTITGVPEVDVTHWLGTAAATPTVAGVPEVDITHFGGSAGTFSSGRAEVNTSHVSGTIQTAGDIIADTNDIQARLPAALVSGRIDASVGAMAANVVTATAVATGAAAEIAGAVWDEDATGHQTTGTFGQAIGDPVADTNTIFKAVVTDATGATVGVDVVAVKAETVSIQSDTDDIQTRLPAALVSGRMDSSVGAIAADTITAAALAADASAAAVIVS